LERDEAEKIRQERDLAALKKVLGATLCQDQVLVVCVMHVM
jgi:hypothetical protein